MAFSLIRRSCRSSVGFSPNADLALVWAGVSSAMAGFPLSLTVAGLAGETHNSPDRGCLRQIEHMFEPLPPPRGEGPAAPAARVGNRGAVPRPDGFAVCPSPQGGREELPPLGIRPHRAVRIETGETSMADDTGLQLRSLVKASGELELSLAHVPVPEPGGGRDGGAGRGLADQSVRPRPAAGRRRHEIGEGGARRRRPRRHRPGAAGVHEARWRGASTSRCRWATKARAWW